jgi:hypothetical protein
MASATHEHVSLNHLLPLAERGRDPIKKQNLSHFSNFVEEVCFRYVLHVLPELLEIPLRTECL